MKTMTFTFRNIDTNVRYTKTYIVQSVKQGHDYAQAQCAACNSVYSAIVKIEEIR